MFTIVPAHRKESAAALAILPDRGRQTCADATIRLWGEFVESALKLTGGWSVGESRVG